MVATALPHLEVVDRAPASAPASPSSGQRWIVGPAFDLLIFIFSAALTLIPWYLVDRRGVHPFYILAGVAIASNGPHLASTWSRIYLDGAERFRRPIAYWLLPACVILGVLSFIVFDGHDSAWLRTILFYWACWHFAAQCYGLLRIYQRKHHVLDTPIARFEKGLLFAGTGWCVMHRLYTGPWELFGVAIWHPSPTAWMVNGAGALVVVAALVYVALWVREGLRGNGYELRRPAMVAASVGAFAVPFLLIHNGTAAFAAAAGWHGIQYFGIVWFYNRNRYRGGFEKRAAIMSYVSQPRRWPLYFATMLAIVGIAYVSIMGLARLTAGTTWDLGTWGLFVWTSLTFSHYYLDGVIWKLRKDQTLVKRLAAT